MITTGVFHVDDECVACFFDRHGGVSGGVFDSLNIGLSTGDEKSNVLRNRVRVKEVMKVSHLLSVHQVHGDGLYVLREDLNGDASVGKYDAMITNRRGVGLMIQTADCQGILFYDPVAGAVGAAHSGWRGSVANIAAVTVEGMVREYGTDPADLRVFVGPSLGPCCAEFVNYREELPEHFSNFMVSENHFDFWDVTRHQLLKCGVLHENIVVAGRCTSCSEDHFSYRRACREGDGVTGRNCSVVALQNQ